MGSISSAACPSTAARFRHGLAPSRALSAIPRQRRSRCVSLAPRAMLPGVEHQLVAAADAMPSQLDMLAARITTQLLTLGDVATSAGVDLSGAQGAVGDAVEAVQDDSKRGGFFGPFAALFESILKVLDKGLDTLHVPYSYGFSIILLTLLVKVATFPLTKKQVESTMAMQVLQPRVKEIQNRFKNDQEKMQLEIGRLYKEAQVNPLAGCLPTLATLPVWIGLYRALSNVADEGLLTEGFFWIPSLAGPTTLALQKSGGGFAWLVPLQDGAPPIGWPAAAAYLSLPVLLVVSQFISQKVISPPASADPQQQSSQWILKFLPFLIGYFALNVPSGLALYWFTNNLLSTAQQVYLKSSYKPAFAGGPPEVEPSSVIPPGREKKKGKDVSGKDVGARRSQKVEATSVGQHDMDDAGSAGSGNGAGPQQGEKFRALKAREAAKRASKVAGTAADAIGGVAGTAAVGGLQDALEGADSKQHEAQASEAAAKSEK